MKLMTVIICITVVIAVASIAIKNYAVSGAWLAGGMAWSYIVRQQINEGQAIS